MLFLFCFFQFEARYLYKQGRGSNLNGCKTVKHDQKHLFRTVVLLLQGKSKVFPLQNSSSRFQTSELQILVGAVMEESIWFHWTCERGTGFYSLYFHS